MPSNYFGRPHPLISPIPTLRNIASSTNTSPINITTATPHGCQTGDIVVIDGHLVNSLANGDWEVVVTGVSTLQLLGSTGNGVGGATGTARSANFGSGYAIPSGTDGFSVAAFNVALEALGDRASLLFYQTQYDQTFWPGGQLTIDAGANIDIKGSQGLHLESAATVQADNGSLLFGQLTIAPGSLLTAGNLGTLKVDDGGFFVVTDGGIANIFGVANVESGAFVHVLAGGQIDVQGDGDAGSGTTPDLRIRGGALARVDASGVLQVQPGANLLFNGPTSGSPTVLATFNGTAVGFDNSDLTFIGNSTFAGTLTDATTTTRTQPTIYSGDNAYRSPRDPLVFGDTDVTVNPEKQDYVICQVTGGAGHLTDDRNCKILLAPAGMRIDLWICARASDLSIKTLTIQDHSGSTLFTLVGTDQGDPKWVRILVSDFGYRVIGSYKASNG